MDELQLVAIMAAIIYAGADDAEKSAGYTPSSAALKAKQILHETKQLLTGAVNSDGGQKQN
jgi:hypothetical protein